MYKTVWLDLWKFHVLNECPKCNYPIQIIKVLSKLMLTIAILNRSMVRDSDLIGVALFPYTSGLPMGTFSKQGAMFASSDPSEFMSSFLPAAHAPSFDSSQWLQMGSSNISKSSRRWISVLQAFETTRASKNKCLPKPKHAKAVSNGPRFHLEWPCSQMPLQQVFLIISSMRSFNLRANVSCLNALTKLQKAFFSNSFGLRHRSAPPQSRRPIEKLKIPIGPIYGEIMRDHWPTCNSCNVVAHLLRSFVFFLRFAASSWFVHCGRCSLIFSDSASTT